MALQWMPHLFQRRTSWKSVLRRVTPVSLGVLHYSAMDSVILFHTTDELKCAIHSIVELMELQDEAITVKAMAPLEAHITTYMTVWHSKPSTGDGESHTPSQ